MYDERARTFVRSWKEKGRRRLAGEASALIAEVIARPDVDVVVHVPGKDPERAWERGSVGRGLAVALGALWELPVGDRLRRLQALPRQRGLALAERRRNVRGSVAAEEAVPRTVCLVDDVYAGEPPQTRVHPH